MKPIKRVRPACGFTLIELLAVIAIIAILAALLFPVISTSIEKGKSIRCNSNLRQIGAACLLYAADNDGGLPSCDEGWPPPPDVWLTVRGVVIKYFGDPSPIECPSDRGTKYPYSPDPKHVQTRFTSDGKEFLQSYSGNNFLSRLAWDKDKQSFAQDRRVRLSMIKWPSRGAIYYDGFRNVLVGNSIDSERQLYSSLHNPKRLDGYVVARHIGLTIGNIALADGHTTTFDAKIPTDVDDIVNPPALTNRMDFAPAPVKKFYWFRL